MKARNRHFAVAIAAAIATNVFFFIAPGALAAGDPKAGEQKSATCQGCHGQDGNSLAPEWPKLASQHASYIQKQVKDFQKGARQDPIMSTMVLDLNETDIADISAYFSSQAIQPTELPKSGDLALGKKIYKGGNTYNDVPACAGCHGPNGVGNAPAVYPRIAGQRPEYLIKALNDFRSGQRANDPNEIMRNIASKLSDREIKAVAEYAASLQ